MIDMIKEMRALERRYHEEQIAEYDRWAAEATNERSRRQWQGLADSFREMGEKFFGEPMPPAKSSVCSEPTLTSPPTTPLGTEPERNL